METRRLSSKTAAVVMVAAALLVAAVPAIAASSVASIQGVSVSGNVVSVTVKNNGTVPVVGYVAVQAVVGDAPIWSFVPVTLGAGASATMSAAFNGPVGRVLTVGVVGDDQTPI